MGDGRWTGEWSADGRSIVRRRRRYGGVSVRIVFDAHSPRLAAHLAVLDVVLVLPAARIDADRDGLAAIRARHLAFGVGSAVTERKVSLEIEVIRLGIKRKLHIENVAALA